MTSVDRQKISKLLDQIRESSEKLSLFIGIKKEEFINDFKNSGSAKYNLVIAVEAMIDVSNHLVAKLKLGTPEDYADIFKILNKLNIFNDEEINKLVEMTRYRNKLVHLYWKIDDSEVYDGLKNNIETFEKFESGIQKYLKRSE